jgi:hypothetical protein
MTQQRAIRKRGGRGGFEEERDNSWGRMTNNYGRMTEMVRAAGGVGQRWRNDGGMM